MGYLNDFIKSLWTTFYPLQVIQEPLLKSKLSKQKFLGEQ